MASPINRLVGKHVAKLERREREGKPPPALAGRGTTRLWYLRRTALFRGFERERLEQLSDTSELRQLARRESWLVDGDEDRVYVIADGAIKLCRVSALGRRLVEGILDHGDVFGTLSTNQKRSYCVEALDRVTLLALPRTALLELLRDAPDLCLDVLQVVEQRERQLSARIESLVFKDVPTRVVETLLALSRDHGEPCQHGFAVDVRVSQQDIADLVGASRQMVNRVIRDLTLKFYVKRKGKVLCILDADRLRRLAEGLP
jgi:CRP-like cAMP-binding protein